MNKHLMFSVLLHNNAEQNYIEHYEFIIILKFPFMEICLFGFDFASRVRDIASLMKVFF